MNISVAMCTYNGARYLSQQLDSIAAQIRQPYELVVCDDGSMDETDHIIASFGARAGFPVRFQKNPVNLGSTRNFEQAMRRCSGDVIAFCDQDDVWLPEKLVRMSEALEARPELAGVFSNARLIDGDGNLMPGDLWQMAGFTAARQARFCDKTQAPFVLVERDTITGAAFMIRSRFIPEVLPISTDWIHDGWIALLLTAIAELQALPECLMSYRLHASQQVGIGEMSWFAHLTTQKKKALAFHRKEVRRFAAAAERLKGLPSTTRLVAELRRKSRFYNQRAAVLERTRLTRLLPLIASLPDYSRYARGFISMLRDLAH